MPVFTFDHLGIYNVTVDAQFVEMYFDNLVYTIPEPTALALLGLGGMMLLWRRKD